MSGSPGSDQSDKPDVNDSSSGVAGDRGPPENVRRKASRRREDGRIEVGADPLEEVAADVDWENLSPFEEWLVALLDEQGLLPEDS